MLKHIVMWKLKEQGEGADKAENAQKIKAMLEGMEDSMPMIRDLEVGINLGTTDATHDIVLYTEFRTHAELEAYQEHPEHKKVAAFIKKVVETRAAIDYIK